MIRKLIKDKNKIFFLSLLILIFFLTQINALCATNEEGETIGCVEEYVSCLDKNGNLIDCRYRPMVLETKPFCGAIETTRRGWYYESLSENLKRQIRIDDCEGCTAICQNIGTTREGWYSSCTDRLIAYTICSEIEKTANTKETNNKEEINNEKKETNEPEEKDIIITKKEQNKMRFSLRIINWFRNLLKIKG
jgi:hypothetical protein